MKAVGITTNDPFGLGTASSTFSGRYGLVKEECYNAFCFRELVNKLNRISDLKIVVGGARAWQLADEKVMDELGIDVVVVGEGEEITPKIFGKILSEDVHGIFYGLQRVRNRPMADIIEEVKINAKINGFATLHAEDVLRYKAIGINSKQRPAMAGQTRIETGSLKLLKEHMSGKVLPFKAED